MSDPSVSGAKLPKLLVLTSTYPRWAGDPEPGFVHELSRRLASNFDTTVLCPHAPGAATSEVLDGVSVIRYRYAPEKLETLVNDGGVVTNLRRQRWKQMLVPIFVLSQLWRAWRLSRAREFDVVHAHWLIPQGWVAAILQHLPGWRTPFIVTSHGADLFALRSRWLRPFKRFVFQKAAVVTVVSGSMREHAVKLLGADANKVQVMPMGVDLLQRFTPHSRGPRSGQELLFVGRLVEKKGGRYLVDAMSVLVKSLPDVRLTIVGFGPEETNLRRQVKALGLERNVNFLGAVPQAALPALYRRATVFIAPFVRADTGDEEGLGLVVVEAAGCGCPVVVGDVSAVHEVLGKKFAHLAVDPRNTELLARRIKEIIATPDSAEECATHLRREIIGRFSWERVADEYSQLLLNLVGRGRLLR